MHSGVDKGFKWGAGVLDLFVNKNNQDFGTKRRAAGEISFDLKDSKRVKINDLRLKN